MRAHIHLSAAARFRGAGATGIGMGRAAGTRPSLLWVRESVIFILKIRQKKKTPRCTVVHRGDRLQPGASQFEFPLQSKRDSVPARRSYGPARAMTSRAVSRGVVKAVWNARLLRAKLIISFLNHFSQIFYDSFRHFAVSAAGHCAPPKAAITGFSSPQEFVGLSI